MMFHRVLPRDELRQHLLHKPRFEISVEFFARVLQELRASDYRFIPLAEMAERLRENRDVSRLACITFDDGFSDIVRHALPLLEEQAAPFTVYVTTGYPDGELLHISAAIEQLVKSRSLLELEVGGERLEFDTSTLEGKIVTAERLEKLAFSAFPTIGEAARAWGFELADARAGGLSWEQISMLANHPLCTVGAHTVTHRDLTLATRDEIRWELEESNRRLELHTGRRTVHFAYPFGRYDEVAREEGLRAGYELMVKTGRACVDPLSFDPCAAPRACPLEDA